MLEDERVRRGRVLEDERVRRGRVLEDEGFSGAECWRMKGSQGQSAGG